MSENPVINSSYELVAKEIIKKSIRSAICIDDLFIEPYMEEAKINSINNKLEKVNLSLTKDIPHQLYKSFRKDGECDLDIYHFENLENSWHPEYMLNNKDLIILDWELEGLDKFNSTLAILDDVLSAQKTPFVIIYTQKPKDSFTDIIKALLTDFNPNSKVEQNNKRDILYAQFKEHLVKISEDKVENWDDEKVEIFFDRNDIRDCLLEFLLKEDKRENAKSLLINQISEEFNIKNIASLNTKIKTILKNTFESKTMDIGLVHLTYLMIDSKSSFGNIVERVNFKEIGFRINNCLITLFSKPGKFGGIKPAEVFNQFSDLISSSPHNFLTLLSIEMRDRFREDFSKIGNTISEIDERAFFHHLNSYKARSESNYKNQFYDFLLNSWINEISDYNINLKPSIFNSIEDYQTANHLDEIDSTKIIQPLADLGVRLSTTNLDDRFERDIQIRFGDIFKIDTYDVKGVKIAGNDEYLISLTPHCVCLDACNKIENNFYFARSENVSENPKSALEKVEKDHYSFVKDNNVIKSIKWGECKPFTLYIEENKINALKANFMNNRVELIYVTTLKENFAQRIANEAFSFGTNVGIDLPNLAKKKKNKFHLK